VTLLLFDIDGTLISTGGAGVRALDRACEEVLSVQQSMDGILPHGKTDPAIIREILAARCPERQMVDCAGHILDAYLTFLVEEVRQAPSYRILPGIESFLEIHAPLPGVALGLATGNAEMGARIKLERGNLNRFFPFGGFGSDSENRTALVRLAAERGAQRCQISLIPSDVFVIGDTPRDIAAGREAGFRTVGVATSSYSREALQAAGADLAMKNFDEDLDQFLRLTRIV
jgi:phosphoglycolate phosphatase-like HAD superfamily hydrolase